MVVLTVALSPSHAALGSAERTASEGAAVAESCLQQVECAGAAAGAVLMAAFALAATWGATPARPHVMARALAPAAPPGRHPDGGLFRPPRPQA
jgi:hypothetical protein